jgi:uroporphyrinogen III methyltransferase/synthase
MDGAGCVYLVGAGPGQPGLVTLRAVECLKQADLVIYDRLVSPRLLDFARPAADKVCVTEFGPCHSERGFPVQAKLIEAARAGRRVVRLKGGDPYLFGRGAEEAEALASAGVPFEVVPGVTAALGVAAFAGIPLTERSHSSAVAFIAGHENPAKSGPSLDWAALSGFPGTLVVYMGLGRLGAIADTLVANGKAGDTPAAVVQSGTTGEQRTVTAELRDIAAAAHREGLSSPALLVIGEVTRLREQLAWFERQPLFGRRVLLCRPRHQMEEVARRLEVLGAVPVLLPTMEIGPPRDWGPVDAALDRLAECDWLVFTSVNGVRSFLGRLLERGKDMRALGPLRLAAIGPSTADALGEFHLRADVVPQAYRSEDLAAVLAPLVAGKRVLLARADRGRPVLRELLGGIAETREVAVYSQTDAVAADPQALELLANGQVNYVLVTSSNIVRALARLLDEQGLKRLQSGEAAIVSISPVTSAAVRELGWPVAAEAEEYTLAGVEKALLRLANQRRSREASHPR